MIDKILLDRIHRINLKIYLFKIRLLLLKITYYEIFKGRIK